MLCQVCFLYFIKKKTTNKQKQTKVLHLLIYILTIIEYNGNYSVAIFLDILRLDFQMSCDFWTVIPPNILVLFNQCGEQNFLSGWHILHVLLKISLLPGADWERLWRLAPYFCRNRVSDCVQVPMCLSFVFAPPPHWKILDLPLNTFLWFYLHVSVSFKNSQS